MLRRLDAIWPAYYRRMSAGSINAGAVVEWLHQGHSRPPFSRDSMSCALAPVQSVALNLDSRWRESLDPDTEHHFSPRPSSLRSVVKLRAQRKEKSAKKAVQQRWRQTWSKESQAINGTRAASAKQLPLQAPSPAADAQRLCGPFRAFGRGDCARAGWCTTRSPEATTRCHPGLWGPSLGTLPATRTMEHKLPLGCPDSAAPGRCWPSARDFSSFLAGLTIPSFFFPFLSCSAIFCYAVLCLCLALPSIKTEPRLELAVPTCRNRRRMQLRPLHDSPLLSLAVSHPPRDDSDPSSAGNQSGETRHHPGQVSARLFLGSTAFSSFLFPRLRLLPIVCYFYDSLDSSISLPFPLGGG
ncbi:hypothetical protein J3F83DRAFT_345095 [Trichoderma novae-zelandiae]